MSTLSDETTDIERIVRLDSSQDQDAREMFVRGNGTLVAQIPPRTKNCLYYFPNPPAARRTRNVDLTVVDSLCLDLALLMISL